MIATLIFTYAGISIYATWKLWVFVNRRTGKIAYSIFFSCLSIIIFIFLPFFDQWIPTVVRAHVCSQHEPITVYRTIEYEIHSVLTYEPEDQNALRAVKGYLSELNFSNFEIIIDNKHGASGQKFAFNVKLSPNEKCPENSIFFTRQVDRAKFCISQTDRQTRVDPHAPLNQVRLERIWREERILGLDVKYRDLRVFYQQDLIAELSRAYISRSNWIQEKIIGGVTPALTCEIESYQKIPDNPLILTLALPHNTAQEK